MISVEFDKSHSQLKNILESNSCEPQPEITKDSLFRLTEAIDLIDREIASIKQVLQGSLSVAQIKARIQNAMMPKTSDVEMSEQSSQSSVQSNQLSNQLSTPQSKAAGMPLLGYEDEDFPSTPTLEQLGLSGPALSIVGGRRLGFDSSASISDTEFDNSFYQKSPVMAGDNSFSSDVSVPNFRILNSSPASMNEKNGGANKRTIPSAKTNLKQVTTAQSDCDSSMLAGDEALESPKPASKRVHFYAEEESENVLLNK